MTHKKIVLLAGIVKNAIPDIHENLSSDWAKEEGSSWSTIGTTFWGSTIVVKNVINLCVH